MPTVVDPHSLLPLVPTSAADATTPANAALMQQWFFNRRLVKSGVTATPPASSVEGDGYIVPAAASGAWAGQDGRLAHRLGGVWNFYQPRHGYAFLVEDTGEFWVYESGAWTAFQRPDHARIDRSGTYNPTAADFLNARMIASSGNLTIEVNTLSLLAGQWLSCLIYRSPGHSVDFSEGTATLDRGDAQAITTAGDAVSLLALDSGATYSVAGDIT